MSRRFGRKQRREARATIDMLCDMLDDNAAFIDKAKRDAFAAERQRDKLLERMEHWDSEIRALLGPYSSAAINDQTYRIDRPEQLRQMSIMPPLRAMPFSASNFGQEEMSYYVESMLGFIAGMHDDDLMRMRRLLTMRVIVGDYDRPERAYYAISESAWQELKRAPPDALRRLADRVAGDLLALMARPPKEQKRA